MYDLTVNRFRQKRGARLRAMIQAEAERLARPIVILDVGGRPDYWLNVKPDRVAIIKVLNLHAAELERETVAGLNFENLVGDACDLADFGDQSIDLVHSNSVVEHVGDWSRMQSMTKELRRVGCAGWVQTPAFEFPIEPHWRMPFAHWFGRPIQSALLKARFRCSHADARVTADSINLVSRRDFITLLPGTDVLTERFMLLPKSYIACWTSRAL